MKRILCLTALVSFSVSARVCQDIPAGADGKRIQTVKSVSGVENHRVGEEYLGEDKVYEGAPCPSGKVCIEYLSNNISSGDNSGSEVLLHGQVIVINKQNGNVDSLEPLAFSNQNRRLKKGLGFLDQSRWTKICSRLKKGSNYYNGLYGNPCDQLYSGQNPYLDLYSYRGGCADADNIYLDRTRAASLYNDYCGFSADAKKRSIEILNSGTLTRPGQWEQGQSVQDGGAGTFKRLAKLVGEVRKGLNCEPIPQRDPRVRLALSLLDQAANFKDCFKVERPQKSGRVNKDDAAIELGFVDNLSAVEDVPRPELTKEEKKARKKNKSENSDDRLRYNFTNYPFEIPATCTSVQTSPSVETISCDNGPIAPADPSAPRSARVGGGTVGDPRLKLVGVGVSQNKIVVRIVDGKVENLNVERNYTYLTDYQKSCTAVEPQTAPGQATPAGSATQQ